VAFLDRGPIRTGHVQIIPRDHFPYFDEAPAS
jgi:histidine triad (HIT) family protein